jgi:hypothetical protein
VNTKKAWLLAVFVAAFIVAGSVVALGGHGGGQPRPVTSQPASITQQAVQNTDTEANSRGPALVAGGPAASVEQVQQALANVLASAMTPVDGQLKPVTPAEIQARVRDELAKIGVQP